MDNHGVPFHHCQLYYHWNCCVICHPRTSLCDTSHALLVRAVVWLWYRSNKLYTIDPSQNPKDSGETSEVQSLITTPSVRKSNASWGEDVLCVIADFVGGESLVSLQRVCVAWWSALSAHRFCLAFCIRRPLRSLGPMLRLLVARAATAHRFEYNDASIPVVPNPFVLIINSMAANPRPRLIELKLVVSGNITTSQSISQLLQPECTPGLRRFYLEANSSLGLSYIVDALASRSAAWENGPPIEFFCFRNNGLDRDAARIVSVGALSTGVSEVQVTWKGSDAGLAQLAEGIRGVIASRCQKFCLDVSSNYCGHLLVNLFTACCALSNLRVLVFRARDNDVKCSLVNLWCTHFLTSPLPNIQTKMIASHLRVLELDLMNTHLSSVSFRMVWMGAFIQPSLEEFICNARLNYIGVDGLPLPMGRQWRDTEDYNGSNPNLFATPVRLPVNASAFQRLWIFLEDNFVSPQAADSWKKELCEGCPLLRSDKGHRCQIVTSRRRLSLLDIDGIVDATNDTETDADRRAIHARYTLP